jgi:cold shock CspA family protein
MRVRGQVVKLVDGRDFGFIHVRDVAEDVFFHFQEVPKSVQTVQVGTTLEFDLVT